jgi:uncharacterized protein YecE (DUF72 family)
MEYGKVTDPGKVDFALPDWRYMAGFARSAASVPALYIGATSWHNAEWKGGLLPAKGLKGQELRYYAQQFNSVEFNGSFYAIPSPEQIARWREQTTADFRFCMKVYQGVSGSRGPQNTLSVWDRFLEAAVALGPQLGMVFWQFPSRLPIDKIQQRLVDWLPYLPTDLPIAFEIRDPSAYEGNTLSELYHLLSAHDASMVITDTPGVRAIVHQQIWGPRLLVRFVTCGALSLDLKRADQWLDQLRLLDTGLVREIYFFIHDHESYRFPEVALYLSDKIYPASLFSGRGPSRRKDSEEQMSLF